MPYHPHATSARASAGSRAPVVPNEARASTGNGMPYFAPAWPISRIGTSTTRLPSKTIVTACPGDIPSSMKPAASM
jgi:hypothetical protein